MSGLSLYGRDQSLAAFFTPELFDAPSHVHVALCVSQPTQGDTGNDLVEPTDPAYQRASYAIGADWWGSTNRGGVANVEEILYPAPTEDWGEITGWALCADAEGGQTYWVGELLVPLRVIYDPLVPQIVGIGAGAIVVKQT